MARVIPDWTELNRLHQPLTTGERALLENLQNTLEDGWEIYAQPFLNGTRPDVVCLHPSRGAVIFEVKDWDLPLYAWQDRNTLRVQSSQQTALVGSPLQKLEHFRQNVLRFYAPQAGQVFHEGSASGLGMVRLGMYFHHATTSEVKRFFDQRPGGRHGALILLGNDSLSEVAPFHVPEKPKAGVLAPELQAWLSPPEHTQEQHQGISLSKEQEKLAKPRAGHHRIRGVAGSGKSLVLAERAARNAQQGKKVLVLSFNITLWHMFRDQVRRTVSSGKTLQGMVFNHYHGFCKDMVLEAGLRWQDETGDLLTEVYPRLLVQACRKMGLQFDSILMDEAQDYQEAWIASLESILKPGGEFVVAVDLLQNLYGRALDWLESPKFKPWQDLSASYRLHEQVILKANAFARQFLPDVGLLAEPRQGMLRLTDPEYFWENPATLADALLEAQQHIQKLLHQGVHPSDMVVLLPNHPLGLQFVQQMQQAGFEVNHVFSPNPDDKRQKYAFWMGDSRLKACTIHSFKGWEIAHVIAVLADDSKNGSVPLDMQTYVAITRAKSSLKVLNLVDRYRAFGMQAFAEGA